jgi:hypothetical protein
MRQLPRLSAASVMKRPCLRNEAAVLMMTQLKVPHLVILYYK